MNSLSPRWRAAGAAALFVLVTWACNCGTFQGLTSSGGEVTDTPTALPAATVEAPTLPPPTDVTPMSPVPESTLSPPTLPPPTEAAPTVAPASGPVLFEDDFSDPGSGWYVDSDEVGSYAYENGVYAITALSNGLQLWGDSGLSFGDAVITVEAVQISGPANDNSGYGIGCRVQDNGDGYFMRITANGDYAIFRYTSPDDPDASGFVSLIDWTPTDAINQGSNMLNFITVTCQGSSLSLSVNGVLLGTTQDSMYASGDVALTATTFEDEPMTVHFDNLVVREP